MRPDLTYFLGRRVTVVVDRPVGSYHPRFPEGEPYPLNYGFVPGTVSGDGEPVDVYLLGPREPVAQAVGTVIAVVLRSGDVEDKLVVATDEYACNTPEAVWAQISFQEDYFDSKLFMPGTTHNLPTP